MIQVALAAANARNPRELWQETAKVIGQLSHSDYVRIDYSDPLTCGSVDWGSRSEAPITKLSFEHDPQRLEVELAVDCETVSLDQIESVVRAAAALEELVSRRMTLEHERRLGSFIVELSRWMLASSTDPAMLLRYTLESILQLVDGDGALVVLTAADGQSLEVVSKTGCMEQDEVGLLELIRPGVAQVVESEAPFLTLGLTEDAGGFGTDEYQVGYASAMFVPLRNTEGVVGTLCIARSTSGPHGDTPFSLNDMSYVEAVASHIAGGLELSSAINRARDAAERAGAMVDGTPFPLAQLAPDGTIHQVNEAFLELSGFEHRELIIGSSVTACSFTVKGGDWQDALDTAKSGVPWRSRVEATRDGEIRYCEATVAPLQDTENGGLLLALHDRTDELRAQKELVTREKLSTVGEIASGVAHEVNNPLATIRLEAELLGGTTGDPETAKTVQTILHEVDRASRIAKGLLCLSRQSMSSSEEVNLNDLIQSVIDVRSRVVGGRGIGLTAKLSPEVPAIMANGGDLQQVFVNLITNAEQAVVASPEKNILVTTEAGAGSVRVIVADSGSGVDPGMRSKIFDPFVTTKGPDAGTGLGLALSQRVVADHGGRISVADSELGGAAFVVELPLGR
jgi:PAS domain S-box-containing protein